MIGKCIECGGWIHPSEESRELHGFVAHERCITDDDLFWNQYRD